MTRGSLHDARRARIEQAYVANAADLLSYFGRRVMVAADAADLLSETFVVAWRRADRMPSAPEQARMWLFGVARKVHANALRSTARRGNLVERLREHLDAAPRTTPDDFALDVRAAIAALPGVQAELVRLVAWDGFTIAEAAAIVGLSETAARGRYQRARAALRERLAGSASAERASRSHDHADEVHGTRALRY